MRGRESLGYPTPYQDVVRFMERLWASRSYTFASGVTCLKHEQVFAFSPVNITRGGHPYKLYSLFF